MKRVAIEARWWKQDEVGRVVCMLCPRECVLGEGQHGFCYVRQNQSGQLVNLAYGHPIALHVDPIEKKPLYHFLPGSSILSLGTAGCNMGCRFCQNWDLTKAKDDLEQTTNYPPEDIVSIAERYGAPSIAFTYNEPTIWGEYVVDVSSLAHQRGVRTVMVTNGYISRDALRDIYAHIDAANVDLKSFTEEFYRGMTLSHLQPVLDTLVRLKNETNTWFEITTLLVPGKNDDPAETRRMCQWISRNLGPDVPLHLTAFHPDYQLMDSPPTSGVALQLARRIAMEEGLRYVYTGNVHDPAGQTTFCPRCQSPLIERDWHSITMNALENGACESCGETIAGCWK